MCGGDEVAHSDCFRQYKPQLSPAWLLFGGSKRWFGGSKRWFGGSKRWFGGSKRSVTGLLAKHKCFVLQLIRCQFTHNQKKIKAPSIGLVRYRPLRLLSCRLMQPVCCFGVITMGRQEEKSSRSLPENLIFYAPMGELVLYNV